jgi:hypothetical protein
VMLSWASWTFVGCGSLAASWTERRHNPRVTSQRILGVCRIELLLS